MVIPPGEWATYEVTHDFEFLRSWAARVTGVEEERIAALAVHSANLHMHAFGRSGEITLVDSDGRSETALRLRCTYHNPTEKPVFGGFGSLDEMCVNFSYISVWEQAPDTESTDSSTARPSKR